ncbi:hypothetical protein NQ117_04835 [Paenibacillus sp. SC116]|uniref:hypothetical protein n=1 Tax=Paenibacillus sp. SC116 TaxID=2968986 RepID=UPI00215ADC0E|nr:hypothetical protein [Paenibacillus sp. SC116]MCR8842998.1 hypothetical protein [Paenibacillus sp. SC116]
MTEQEQRYRTDMEPTPQRRRTYGMKSEHSSSQALKALKLLKKSNTEHVHVEETTHEGLPSEAMHELIAAREEEDRTLPPRSALYPSSSGRLSKWFYNILFFLFVALLVALLIWGRQIVEGS